MKKKGVVAGIKSYIARLNEEMRFSTAKSYRDALNSLVGYCGTEDIPYGFMNKNNLRCYEAYLAMRGCSRNTTSTYMRRLRYVYNRAVENGEAEFIPNLFRDVFTGVESRCKKSLSIEEQHKLMTIPLKDARLRQTQLAVCLMFQYGGMAFVDFAHLKANNIRKQVLDYKRQKTGTPMRLEILKTAEIMREELVKKAEDTGKYLYPFLSGKREGLSEYKEYNMALARFNRNLRALGKIVGLKSKITSYSIRHSFAMALKERGVPIEMISELLGHKSIKTTQIYLRSFSLDKQTAANYACFESVYNFTPKAG